MMRRQILFGILIIFVLISFNSLLSKQSYNEINYFIKSLSYKDDLRDVSILNINSSYYVIANLVNDKNFIVSKISYDGKTVSAYKISYNEGLIINSAIKDTKNNIVYLGNTNTGKLVIINNVWNKLLYFENGLIAKSILAIPEGYLILAKLNTNDSLILFFINNEGDIIWSKVIKTDYKIEPIKIINSYDNSFVLISNLENKGILITRITNEGNIVWSKLLIAPQIKANSLINARDKGYIIIGNSDNEGFIIKISNEGELISAYKIYPRIKLSDIITSVNNGYIISGLYNDYFNNYALIILLDNEFNIVKSFFLNLVNSVFNKVISSEFSYVFLGNKKDSKTNLLIMKIDKGFSVFLSYIKQVNLETSKEVMTTLSLELSVKTANLATLNIDVTKESLNLNEITIQSTNIDPAVTTITVRISPVTTVTNTITPIYNFTVTQTVSKTTVITYVLNETVIKQERTAVFEPLTTTTTEIIQDLPLSLTLLLVLFIISLGIILAFFRPFKY